MLKDLSVFKEVGEGENKVGATSVHGAFGERLIGKLGGVKASTSNLRG